MKNLTSWLLVMFMIMFWLFRTIMAFLWQYGNDFGGFIIFNQTVEIVLLFIAILCVMLFLRRNIIGGIIYLISYGYYFGGYLIKDVLPIVMHGKSMSIEIMQNAMISAVGVLIAICVFTDLLIDRARKRDPKDKKTDWFFKNEQFDRKFDERADKNQYRNY